MSHFLLLCCYLVVSCRQKMQRCLKKGFSAHQPHQLNALPDNLLMAEWVPSATCLSLGLILKCVDPVPTSTDTSAGNEKPRELLPLWMCITLHGQGKILAPHNLCRDCLPNSCRAERFWLLQDVGYRIL